MSAYRAIELEGVTQKRKRTYFERKGIRVQKFCRRFERLTISDVFACPRLLSLWQHVANDCLIQTAHVLRLQLFSNNCGAPSRPLRAWLNTDSRFSIILHPDAS